MCDRPTQKVKIEDEQMARDSTADDTIGCDGFIAEPGCADRPWKVAVSGIWRNQTLLAGAFPLKE